MLVVMKISHVKAIPKIEVGGASDFLLLVLFTDRWSIDSKMCCIARALDIIISTSLLHLGSQF
jgi:hypothetical protein